MLNKKQVKAFLEVMSKDETRPALCRAVISSYEEKPYLVTTDGYMLAALELPEECRAQDGRSISREDIVKWYKLADNKTLFGADDIKELAQENDTTYPDWQNVIPVDDKKALSDRINLNPRYLITMNNLDGESLAFNFYDYNFTKATSRRGIYVVCGYRVDKGHLLVNLNDYNKLVDESEPSDVVEAILHKELAHA